MTTVLRDFRIGARRLLRAVKSRGDGHIDSSAVVTVLEAMAATSLAPKADAKG